MLKSAFYFIVPGRTSTFAIYGKNNCGKIGSDFFRKIEHFPRSFANKNAESIQNKQTKSIQSISPFKEIIHH